MLFLCIPITTKQYKKCLVLVTKRLSFRLKSQYSLFFCDSKWNCIPLCVRIIVENFMTLLRLPHFVWCFLFFFEFVNKIRCTKIGWNDVTKYLWIGRSLFLHTNTQIQNTHWHYEIGASTRADNRIEFSFLFFVSVQIVDCFMFRNSQYPRNVSKIRSISAMFCLGPASTIFYVERCSCSYHWLGATINYRNDHALVVFKCSTFINIFVEKQFSSTNIWTSRQNAQIPLRLAKISGRSELDFRFHYFDFKVFFFLGSRHFAAES